MKTRSVWLAIAALATGCVGNTAGDAPPAPPGTGPGGGSSGGYPSGSPGGASPPATPPPPGVGTAPAGGDLGVTPGGAKDIGYARDVISHGGVPDPATITVEGLLSEHDLPVTGGPCEGLLCVRPALGVAPFLETGKLEHFVQIGFTSGFHRDTFRRPPIDLMVLIDHSVGMSIDQVETNAAVMSLVGKMREDDRLGVMIFNDTTETLAPIGAVINAAALEAKVRAVKPTGGFKIATAMEAAYRALAAVPASPQRMRRLMVFSCGYPQISETLSDPVSTLVKSHAEQRIGLSFFGVLLGWNPMLAKLLGQVRGGAAYYLQDLAKVEQVFDADFDFMVTPILYDLKLAVEPGAAFEVVQLYGLPGADAPVQQPQAPPTEGQTGGAFLSSRKGAIVAQLRLKEGASRGSAVGTVTLRYAPEPALGFGETPVEQRADVADLSLPAETPGFEGVGVRKAAALVNQAVRMKAACNAYRKSDKASAAAILTALRDHLQAEATALDDAGLRDEVKLVMALLVNVGR
jgi:Ca-activated chloride channel homolog